MKENHLGKIRLEGTQTSINLAKAFVGESQARNRYLFYSEVAKEEGYASIEQVFLQAADNERGHGEIIYDYLTAGLNNKIMNPEVSIVIAKGTTMENLFSASQGEYEETTSLYPSFGEIAKKEGFDIIATSFFSIAKVEMNHYLRYKDLLERMKSGMLYKQPKEVCWECINCGYRHMGTSAPEICPSCRHPQNYFKIVCETVL